MTVNKLVWILVFILSISFVSATVTDNLAFCYDFENNLTDGSGNGNDLINGSGSQNYVSGINGQAYDIVTTTYWLQNQSATSGIDATGDKTFCGWFNAQTNPSTLNAFYDIGKIEASGTSNKHFMSYELTGSTLTWNSYGTDVQYSFNPTLSSWFYECNVWYEDNNTIITYVNGSSVAESGGAKGASGIDLTGAGIRFGRWTTNDVYRGDFYVDSAMFWNQALNTSDITALFNSGSGRNCSYLVGSPTASNFTVTAKNIWDSSSILVFNATINGTLYESNATTGEVVTPYLDNESVLVNITVVADDYFSNTTLNVNTSSNFEADLYKYTGIYAKDLFNSSSINNFDIYYINNNNASDTGTASTTTGVVYLPFYNSTYEVTIGNASQGAQLYASDIQNLTASNYLRNYTFSLYHTNTVNITFNYETNLSLATGLNITTSLIIEGVWANNYSTSNGTLYLSELNSGDYEIRYSSSGYPERSHFFTLTNQTYNAITLYINNDTTQVTNTLYDEVGTKLEDYYIKLLRYYVTSNSYILVDSCRTNFLGECVLNIKLDDPYYKFRITNTSGYIFKTTTSTKVYENSLTHFIVLGDPVGAAFTTLNDVSGDVSFLNASNQFKYTFDNNAGTTGTATLEVYSVSATGNTLIGTTESTSSSGTLYYNVTDDNQTTYIAKGYWGDTLFDTETYSFKDSQAVFGLLGLLFTMILVIAITFLGIQNPTVAVILVPVSLILTRITGLNTMAWYIITAIAAVSMIIIYLMSDRA